VERAILTPDILAEEAMLVQFRIDVLESELGKETRYALQAVISEQISVQKRILRNVHTLWNAMMKGKLNVN